MNLQPNAPPEPTDWRRHTMRLSLENQRLRTENERYREAVHNAQRLPPPMAADGGTDYKRWYDEVIAALASHNPGGPTVTQTCPECKHPWDAHQGRPLPHYHACRYKPYAGFQCHCRSINPSVQAEENRAAALWRMTYPTTQEDRQ